MGYFGKDLEPGGMQRCYVSRGTQSSADINYYKNCHYFSGQAADFMDGEQALFHLSCYAVIIFFLPSLQGCELLEKGFIILLSWNPQYSA